MRRRDLDSGSRQPLSVTGAEVDIPAGVGQGRALSTSLRLGPGTWEIFSGKMNTATRLLEHPDPADPTWPAVMRIRHGTGRATWLEDLPMVARGMRVTRTGDYLEVSVLVPASETIQVPSVALVAATQPIVRPEDPLVSTRATADAAGLGTHAVPIGASTADIHANAISVMRWRDAAGTGIVDNTPATALQSANYRVPTHAVTLDLFSVANQRQEAVWKVLG